MVTLVVLVACGSTTSKVEVDPEVSEVCVPWKETCLPTSWEAESSVPELVADTMLSILVERFSTAESSENWAIWATIWVLSTGFRGSWYCICVVRSFRKSDWVSSLAVLVLELLLPADEESALVTEDRVDTECLLGGDVVRSAVVAGGAGGWVRGTEREGAGIVARRGRVLFLRGAFATRAVLGQGTSAGVRVLASQGGLRRRSGRHFDPGDPDPLGGQGPRELGGTRLDRAAGCALHP